MPEDKTFSNINFQEAIFENEDYENCLFNNCNFESTDISGVKFIDCVFTDCNLSLVQLSKTVFRNVTFKGCKMLGLHFENCNEFGVSFSFENCILNHSSFYKTKIKKTVFKGCQLIEVDFTEADMSECMFDNNDFKGASFDSTNIEKADLVTSFNYSIDANINKIKKAKFSLTGVVGLLDKYDIKIDRTK